MQHAQWWRGALGLRGLRLRRICGWAVAHGIRGGGPLLGRRVPVHWGDNQDGERAGVGHGAGLSEAAPFHAREAPDDGRAGRRGAGARAVESLEVFGEELQLLEDAQAQGVRDVLPEAGRRRGAESFESGWESPLFSLSSRIERWMRTRALENGERCAPTHDVFAMARFARLELWVLQAVGEKDLR